MYNDDDYPHHWHVWIFFFFLHFSFYIIGRDCGCTECVVGKKLWKYGVIIATLCCFFRFGWNRYDVLLWLFLVLERNRRISHEKVERNPLELVYNKFGEEIGVLVALFGKKWHELAFDGHLFREVVDRCCQKYEKQRQLSFYERDDSLGKAEVGPAAVALLS